jgi:hypothetical protein
MPSTPEPRATLGPIVGRALLYALAIAALVVWGPAEQHMFIYQGF